MRRCSKIKLIVAFLAIGMFAREGLGQTDYPDTMHFPVILYDYKADGSNPAIEQDGCNFGPCYGIVQPSLGPNRKPLYNSSWGRTCLIGGPLPPTCAESVGAWFYPSGAAGKSATASWYLDPADLTYKWQNLVARPGGSPGEYIASDHSVSYALKNIVIYDSLPFLYMGSGVYRFERNADGCPNCAHARGGFFWIDNRGFGNEPLGFTGPDGQPHNFGFTMELHHDFVYLPGLSFQFTGDDDVWLFVNDSLVFDLGGAHGSMSGSINLDDFAGWLSVGEMYNFDLFYCERHTTQSNISITTNILTNEVGVVAINAQDTVLVAGDILSIGAILVTNTGDTLDPGNPEYDNVTWEMVAATTRPGDSLGSAQGASTSFSATMAHRCVDIRTTYSKGGGSLLYDFSTTCIVPAAPDKIYLESDSTLDPWTPDNLSLVTLPDGVNTSGFMYASVRDRFLNLVTANEGKAASAVWRIDPSTDQSFASVATEGANWKAVINRVNDGYGDTRVIVLQVGIPKPDTAQVQIRSFTITQIRALDATSGNVITSVNMNADDSITIHIQGLPSNATDASDQSWEEVTAVVSLSGGLTSDPLIPAGPVNTWTYKPANTGTGTLTVSGESVQSGLADVVIPVTINPPSSVKRVAGRTWTFGIVGVSTSRGSETVTIDYIAPSVGAYRVDFTLLDPLGRVFWRYGLGQSMIPGPQALEIDMRGRRGSGVAFLCIDGLPNGRRQVSRVVW